MGKFSERIMNESWLADDMLLRPKETLEELQELAGTGPNDFGLLMRARDAFEGGPEQWELFDDQELVREFAERYVRSKKPPRFAFGTREYPSQHEALVASASAFLSEGGITLREELREYRDNPERALNCLCGEARRDGWSWDVGAGKPTYAQVCAALAEVVEKLLGHLPEDAD